MTKTNKISPIVNEDLYNYIVHDEWGGVLEDSESTNLSEVGIAEAAEQMMEELETVPGFVEVLSQKTNGNLSDESKRLLHKISEANNAPKFQKITLGYHNRVDNREYEEAEQLEAVVLEFVLFYIKRTEIDNSKITRIGAEIIQASAVSAANPEIWGNIDLGITRVKEILTWLAGKQEESETDEENSDSEPQDIGNYSTPREATRTEYEEESIELKSELLGL